MGLFWDLIQQSQIEDQKTKAMSLEQRVNFLERDLSRTKQLLALTLKVLEEHVGQDIDGDGRTG